MADSATVLIGPPPRETPFFVANGRVSQPWLDWFNQIARTGQTVQNLQLLQMIAEDNSTDGNTSAILAEVLDMLSLASTPPRPPALFEMEMQRDPEIGRLRADVDELRALLNAGNPAPFGALGSAAFQDVSAFDPTGSAAACLLKANNLSDVANATTSLSNLVGAVQTYTPSVSCSGSMTASASSGNAVYVRLGPLVYVQINWTVTLGGTASNAVIFSLPLSSAAQGGLVAPLAGTITTALTTFAPAMLYVSPSNQLYCYVNSGANYPLGATTFYIGGLYRTA